MSGDSTKTGNQNYKYTVPTVFISYAQTSEAYKNKVLELAGRLVSDGIDVVIDIWNLKAGQNKNVFMEKNIHNPQISKVLILCNKTYGEKANLRNGGVGIESDLISSQIYNNAEQDRFIPVVMEKDNKGNAYLPYFLTSSWYIDLSGEQFEEGYKALIRAILDYPQYPKGSIGELPKWVYGNEDFYNEQNTLSLNEYLELEILMTWRKEIVS